MLCVFTFTFTLKKNKTLIFYLNVEDLICSLNANFLIKFFLK